MDDIDFLAHIDRGLAHLPLVSHTRKGLAHRVKQGNTWVDVPYGSPMIVDMLNAQSGWVEFIKGEGRRLTVAPAGAPRPAKPSDSASGIGVVPVTNSELHAELQIDNTVVRNAFAVLYRDYRAAPQAAQGKLPVVNVSGGAQIAFAIIEWEDRDVGFWGEPLTAAPSATSPAAVPPAAAPAPVPEKDQKNEVLIAKLIEMKNRNRDAA